MKSKEPEKFMERIGNNMKRVITTLTFCLALILILGTLLTACGESATTTVTSSSTATQTTTITTTPTVVRSVLKAPQDLPDLLLTPKYGGTITVVSSRPITNIGAPWRPIGGAEKPWNRFAIENLIGLDSKGNAVPQLATSWEQDAAKMTITFTLREGVKFHDGTPFNAEAVKWNMETYMNGTLPDLKSISSIDILGDYKVRLNLSSWDPEFVDKLQFGEAGSMVSPTANQKLIDAGKENDCLLQAVGTGPFKLVSFDGQASSRFERFDDYWQDGLPYLDAVIVDVVLDPVVTAAAFEAGDVDWVTGVPMTDLKRYIDEGYNWTSFIANIWCFAGDSKNADSPFSDIRVRQAICYGCDFPTILDDIYLGLKKPTDQFAAEGYIAYDSTIKGYPYNPDKAKELLGLAGYNAANPLEISIYYTGDPTFTDFYTVMQDQLKSVNVNFKLVTMDNASIHDIQNNGWTNGLVEYRLSYNGIETKYLSGLLQNLSPYQTAYVSIDRPAAYDALYMQIEAETDLAKRADLYKQLNKMVIDEYCMVIPAYLNINYGVMADRVHDCGLFGDTLAEFLPEIIWVSE